MNTQRMIYDDKKINRLTDKKLLIYWIEYDVAILIEEFIHEEGMRESLLDNQHRINTILCPQPPVNI